MATMLLIFAFVMSLIINFARRIIDEGSGKRLPETDEIEAQTDSKPV